MPIVERLMLPGNWDITLQEDTPKNVLDVLDGWFGHVFIMPNQVTPHALGDAGMKSNARYVGIVRKRPTTYQVGGPGLLAWLGDENGKGFIYEAALTRTTNTFVQWVTALLPGAPYDSIHAGTLTAVGGTLTNTYQWVTPRVVLDNVCQILGGEYRIRNDATIDAGPSSSLFVQTPTAIVTRLPGGRDISVVGLLAQQLDLEKDADDYSTRVIISSTLGAAFANGPATPYKDLRGNSVYWSRFITDTLTPAAGLAAIATYNAALWSQIHTQTTLSVLEYDIGRDVKVGDWIYVWDQQRNLVDTANPVRYRGSTIYPMKLRTLACTWPVEQGMGVYYRDSAGVYTDLSPFIAYETPGATFEVGAVMRRLT